MHILTGLIVAGLLGRRGAKKSGDPGFPLFQTGPLRVAHALPGRVRLLAPRLKHVPASELPLEQLRKLSGVCEVAFNPLSGSLLLHYDPKKIEPVLLFSAVVRLLGLEAELDAPPDPLLARELRELGAGANRAVYEASRGAVDLWTLAALGMLSLGASRLLREGQLALPAGFTLIWWGLHALPRGEASQ